MVSDIFREVDEEVRRERLKQLWDRYGNIAILVALIVVIGIGGWRGYQWWEAKKAAEAGAQFEAALKLSAEGKQDEAEAAFVKLASDGTAGYQMLARFRAAEELAKREPQAGVKAYDALAADSRFGQTMQDLAAVRAGLILLDSAPFDAMRTRLEPLTAQDRTFHHSARELLALSAWRTGESAAIRRWVDLIMTDAETPAAVRSRVEMLSTLASGTNKG